MKSNLTLREETVLSSIVYSFIKIAAPIASDFIAKNSQLSISSATIRNTMAKLENEGFINHPHTSAGRIPTDKGYRLFVNSLMKTEELNLNEKDIINSQIKNISSPDDIILITSKLISEISNQLGVVTFPRITEGVLQKIELVSISSTKLMVILSIKSGLAKTILLEVENEISRNDLDKVSQLLNEKLTGLTLKEIKETFADRIKDSNSEKTGLLKLFLNSSNKIFDETLLQVKIKIAGSENLISQKDFNNFSDIKTLLELISQDDLVIQILNVNEKFKEDVKVSIGKELKENQFERFSIIKTNYKIGNLKGTIGIIGNKRMNYPKLIPAIKYISNSITNNFAVENL